MKTRTETLKKRNAINARWEKQQNTKNKNISNLFKANKYRKTKGNLRKNQAKMEPKTKDACTQTTVETNSTASQTQTEMKEVFVQTSTKTKSASTQTNVFLANPRSPPISPSGRPRKPLENLSNTRIEKIAKELANFHKERTPDAEGNPSTYNVFRLARHSLNVFTPEKPTENKKTYKISGTVRFYKALAKDGFDIFVSRREFFTTKNQIAATLDLHWTDNFLTCVNIKDVITRRIEQLRLTAGNDLTKLLQAEVRKKSLSKLIEQQEFQQAAALWHKLIEGINWWFTQSGSHLFADPMETADLVEKGAELLFRIFKVLRNNLENIAANGCINLKMREKATSAAKKARPFPKLHYLRHHCAEFIRKNGWWGIASEQAIESYHAVFNRLELRFRNNRDRKLQIERMMRHQFLLNYLHDHGFDD
uniref:Uncharacterized protein n=1 Tax=Meloidogyne hapla TaxID=6305 RepID=A0A1I8C1N4_MELHA